MLVKLPLEHHFTLISSRWGPLGKLTCDLTLSEYNLRSLMTLRKVRGVLQGRDTVTFLMVRGQSRIRQALALLFLS